MLLHFVLLCLIEQQPLFKVFIVCTYYPFTHPFTYFDPTHIFGVCCYLPSQRGNVESFQLITGLLEWEELWEET